MALSKKQSEQICLDLVRYILDQGGAITTERLQPFYARHPTYRALVKNIRTFCAQHPDRISVSAAAGPHYCLKVPMTKDHKAIAKANLKGKGKGKGTPPTQTAQMVAANLALYAHQSGGSLMGSQMGDYYKAHPTHKDFISGPGLRNFCSGYDGLFAFEADEHSGRVCLASFCCHFLRDSCNHNKNHQGRLHEKPQSTPVVCHLRADCPHEHWQKLLKTAARCESTTADVPQQIWRPVLATLSGSVTADAVAASLFLYVHSVGGSMRGGDLGQYYRVHPNHKDLISSAGLRSFCSDYDGLFSLESDGNQGRVCLATFCCCFLRGNCFAKMTHQGKQHGKPQSSLVACNRLAKCVHGH